MPLVPFVMNLFRKREKAVIPCNTDNMAPLTQPVAKKKVAKKRVVKTKSSNRALPKLKKIKK